MYKRQEIDFPDSIVTIDDLNSVAQAANAYTDSEISKIDIPVLPDNLATTNDLNVASQAANNYTDTEIGKINIPQIPDNLATIVDVTDAITTANNYTNTKVAEAKTYTNDELGKLNFATEDYANQRGTIAVNTSNQYTTQEVNSLRQYTDHRTLLPSKLSGYPDNADYFLNGKGIWRGINSFSSTLNMNNNKIENLSSPQSDNDATNKAFVENLVNNISYSDLTGTPAFTYYAGVYNISINNSYTNATETGVDIKENSYSRLKIGYNASQNYGYVNLASTSESVKYYIGSHLAYQVYSDGIRLHNNKIMESQDPTLLQDLANKRYVDNKFSSLASSSSSSNPLDSVEVNVNGVYVNWLRRSNLTKSNVQIYGQNSGSFIIEHKSGESCGAAFNGDSDGCTIWSAGDSGAYLNVQDEDSQNSRIAYVGASGSWTSVSSRLNKTSIKKKANNNVLDRFMQLDVKSYGMKYEQSKLGFQSEKKKKRIAKKADKMHVGLILEEVFKIFPNCIGDYTNKLSSKRDKDLKIEDHIDDIKNAGIDYNSLLCYFIIAFQEFVQKHERTIKK